MLLKVAFMQALPPDTLRGIAQVPSCLPHVYPACFPAFLPPTGLAPSRRYPSPCCLAVANSCMGAAQLGHSVTRLPHAQHV